MAPKIEVVISEDNVKIDGREILTVLEELSNDEIDTLRTHLLISSLKASEELATFAKAVLNGASMEEDELVRENVKQFLRLLSKNLAQMNVCAILFNPQEEETQDEKH